MPETPVIILKCNGRTLTLNRPRVMGVINVTPDSFFDGGRYQFPTRAVELAQRMHAEGADIIDVGGESTRPGAVVVSVDEELSRVVPVVQALREAVPAVISVDTSKPEVMRAAVEAGAGLINDVNALRAENALQTVYELGVPVCLMHMQGSPHTMQKSPEYNDVFNEVYRFLETRAKACRQVGIAKHNILVDPGFGFGKTLQHNLMLFKRLSSLTQLGYPLLVGVSRKSMIGALLDKPADQRLWGSMALAGLAVWLGASIVRVHDVAETIDAVKVCAAVRDAGDAPS